MKLRLPLLAIVCIAFNSIHSQSLSYQFPEKFDKAYNLDLDKAFSSYKKLMASQKKSIDGNWVCNMYNTQFELDNNKVYINWQEPESYLLKLLDTLVADTCKGKSNLTIFISRDPRYSAKISSNGLIFINIGLLARIRSEAALAYIITHESGHFLIKPRPTKSAHLPWSGSLFHPNVLTTYEFEDSVAIYGQRVMKSLNYNMNTIVQQFDYMDMQSEVSYYSRGYEAILQLEADAKKKREEEEKLQKQKNRNKKQEKPNDSVLVDNGKNYLIDSVFFHRLRKAAREECKKIYFENASYNDCLEIAFVDYLREPKNMRNMYYLIESIRRLLYVKPQLAQDPFLMNDVFDEELFYQHKSVLYRPDYFYTDVLDHKELKDHPLFTAKKKPFNTYKEALYYFTNIALDQNFNEANLCRALYSYANKHQDSMNIYLDAYINNGSGLYIDYAKTLKKEGQPYVERNKTLILVDNIGNYSTGDYYFSAYKTNSYNYFLCKKRAENNTIIRSAFIKDSINTNLVIMNELLGQKPAYLYRFQKLEWAVQRLYNEDDIQVYKKIRLSSKEKQEEFGLSHKFNKHFLILAPEFYSWFTENGYNKLFFVETVHQSKSTLENMEMFNTYTGYYLDINAMRPYFKDAVRSGFNVKQTDAQIYGDLSDFLYGTQ